MDNQHLFSYDNQIRATYPTICGVDEAGRGPLAGPVCCASVILKDTYYSPLLNDSKKVSKKNREILYREIIENAVSYNVQFISPDIIDDINILHASLLGMQKAIDELAIKPSMALIDGNVCPSVLVFSQPVIKGDSTSACIAAASILAKVARDHYMLKLHEQFPEYQLDKHKGYPTKLHYEMIEKHGVQSFHRKSFLKKRGIT